MKKVPSSSPDLTNENIKKLKELFPEILTDGEQIDLDKLITILGQEVNGEKERYSFNWHGKKDAILGAQKPSKGTLRPDKEKSKNFDTTENLYIEGDNLEVLKLLQKSYSNKIKMIYIDPPYNTGYDLIYKNDFEDDIKNYLKYTGQIDGNNGILHTNSDYDGKVHTNWLNMMYSRIKVSKSLLKKDGVFVIAIDHYEVANLIKICDEIYGESNKLGVISVVHKPEGRNQARHFGPSNEFALFYARDKNTFNFEKNIIDEELKELYDQKDEKGLYRLKNFIRLSDGKYSLRESKPDFFYPIYVSKDLKKISIEKFDNSIPVYPVTKTGVERTWKTSKTTCEARIRQKDIIAVIEDNEVIIYEKLRENQVLKTHWIKKQYHAYHYGTKVLDNLLGIKTFDFPKSLNLIKDTLNICINESDIILDFFSGSATTAHATMQLNAEDCGNRKFIMVQLPEKLDEKSEAYKDGYRTICDIGEERIRRAGELVKQELIEKNNKAGMLADDFVDPEQLDVGFKVMKLDKSNIREWNSDFEDLEDSLFAYEDVFVEGRSELDVVYEIMLKNGLDLTYKVNQFEHDGRNIYDVAYGNLFVCLADDIDVSVAQGIINKRNEYGTDTSSVVFKDAGFKSDADKLNVIELLKDSGYPEENILSI